MKELKGVMSQRKLQKKGFTGSIKGDLDRSVIIGGGVKGNSWSRIFDYLRSDVKGIHPSMAGAKEKDDKEERTKDFYHQMGFYFYLKILIKGCVFIGGFCLKQIQWLLINKHFGLIT